jgi:hypothetical protein
VTVFFYNHLFVRFSLELHGIFRLLFCVLRYMVLKESGFEEDGFRKSESEPTAGYNDDEAFAEEEATIKEDEIVEWKEQMEKKEEEDDEYGLEDDKEES